MSLGLCLQHNFSGMKRTCCTTGSWQCCLSLEVMSSIPAGSTIIYRFLCGFICISLCQSIKIKPTSEYEPYLMQSTGVQSLWMSSDHLTEMIGYQDSSPITGCQATCPIQFSQTSLWLLMILQAFWLGLPMSSTHRVQSKHREIAMEWLICGRLHFQLHFLERIT